MTTFMHVYLADRTFYCYFQHLYDAAGVLHLRPYEFIRHLRP